MDGQTSKYQSGLVLRDFPGSDSLILAYKIGDTLIFLNRPLGVSALDTYLSATNLPL